MDVKLLVETIVRELLEQSPLAAGASKPKRPKALFIFCDSRAHEAFADHFIYLGNHGVEFDLLFLDGETSAWLGLHQIEASGVTGKVIAADEYAPAPLELPKDYDAVVVPEIDLDNAARIAAGLKGTVKAEIVFAALVLDKVVIMGEDVAGLKRADRRTLKVLELPKPYRRKFVAYIEQLKEMGIHFVPQKQLAEQAVLLLSGDDAQGMAQAAKQPLERTEGGAAKGVGSDRGGSHRSIRFDEKLLSADWVKSSGVREGETIVIPARTVVSPLAYDMLKERRVSVHYETE